MRKPLNLFSPQSFASKHPDMAFTHMYPGYVRTGFILPKHWALRPFHPVINGLVYPISISVNESAEYHLHTLLNGESGAFRRGPKGDVLEKGSDYFSTEDARTRLWDHTLKATTVA